MDVLAEYRRRAADCEQLAKEALTEDHRQKILTIATSWRQLADQRERMSLTVDKAKPPQQRDPRDRPR